MQDVTSKTPVAFFLLRDLSLTCADCGDQTRPFTHLVGKGIHPATEIGTVLPRLTCRCGKPPIAAAAVCSWPHHGAQPPIDLTPFLTPQEPLL